MSATEQSIESGGGGTVITGTPHFISKFNAAGTNIIDSPLFVDNATNYIGLNTIVPTASFHIKGIDDSAFSHSLKIESGIGLNLFNVKNNGVYTSGVSPNGWYIPSFVTGEITSGQLLNSNNWNNISGGDLFNGNPYGVKIVYATASYDVLSALEIQNVSAITTKGNLLLMKSGGVVGVGTTSPTMTFDVRSSFQNIANFKSNAVGTIGTVYVDGDAGSQIHYYDSGIYKAGFGYNSVTSFWHTNGDYIGISVNNGGGYPFIMKPTGVISLPNVQVGNAGMVSGDTYKDTAANILANGDYVLAIKS